MNDNAKIVAFERKLKLLKDEEEVILKILKNVQNQLQKYEVEELQTSCELNVSTNDNEESESDDSIDGNPESLFKALDCTELINDTSLNLTLNKIFGKDKKDGESEELEEEEEDDQSD